MKALQKMIVQWVQECFVYKPFYFGSSLPSHFKGFSIY